MNHDLNSVGNSRTLPPSPVPVLSRCVPVGGPLLDGPLLHPMDRVARPEACTTQQRLAQLEREQEPAGGKFEHQLTFFNQYRRANYMHGPVNSSPQRCEDVGKS